MKETRNLNLPVVVVTLAFVSIVCGCKLVLPENESGLRTLPNKGLSRLEVSSDFYDNIYAFFGNSGLNVKPDASKLSMSWPLSTETVLLTRFGTPTIGLFSNENGGEVKLAYFHEAIDIRRATEAESDVVYAPVSGSATVINDGDPSSTDVSDYTVAVAIYDPESRLVVSLLHVRPADLLKIGQLTNVKRGDIIGNLASVDSMKPEFEKEFRHTHLSVVDVLNKKLIDPLNKFPQYKDTVHPTIKSIYITDEDGRRSDSLKTGALDIVADIFDRDLTSQRNFEITSLAFKISDDLGNTLKEVQKCDLTAFTEYSLVPSQHFDIRSLLDIGSALAQVSDKEWIGIKTDAANSERSFRYALTNIKSGTSGCHVVPDADGTITVPENVEFIEVFLTVYDGSGNSSKVTKRLERSK